MNLVGVSKNIPDNIHGGCSRDYYVRNDMIYN